MAKSSTVQGELHQYEQPSWEPLLDLLGEELVGDFMWMHELRMATGERVHAYKHRDTRRYIHLSEHGRTYVYIDHDRYRVIPALDAVHQALRIAIPPPASGL
jgi:hypothetical protein